MARLSSEEQKLLKKLQRKADAPDEPVPGKIFNIAVDLGDAAQVAAATKLGLGGLLSDDDDDDDEVEDGSDDQEDDKPKRRGYFDD